MAYGAVDRKTWNDERFRTWANDTKLIWLYLLTCPHGNRIGCFVLDPRYAAADLDMSTVEIEGTLEFLEDEDRIVWDPAARVVCIKRHLHPDYNPLANQSVAKAAKKDLQELPTSMKCFHALLEAVEKWSRPHYEPFTEALMHRVQQGDPQGGVHQEQEQDHEQEQEHGTEGSLPTVENTSEAEPRVDSPPRDKQGQRKAAFQKARGRFAGAIREHVYDDRGQPPDITVKGRPWSTGRDLSICKQFVLDGYGPDKVEAAIRGYGEMIDRKHPELAFATDARRTLLPIRDKEQQGVPLIETCASYWYKHGTVAGSVGNGGPEHVSAEMASG